MTLPTDAPTRQQPAMTSAAASLAATSAEPSACKPKLAAVAWRWSMRSMKLASASRPSSELAVVAATASVAMAAPTFGTSSGSCCARKATCASQPMPNSAHSSSSCRSRRSALAAWRAGGGHARAVACAGAVRLDQVQRDQHQQHQRQLCPAVSTTPGPRPKRSMAATSSGTTTKPAALAPVSARFSARPRWRGTSGR